MCAVCHDGGRYDSESASTKHNEHNHGIGGFGFIRIERLELTHGFESHRGSGVVESEHVGSKIHEHRAVDRVVVWNIWENTAKKRSDAARECVDNSALLPDIENTHPKSKYTSKPDGNLKTILGGDKSRIENLREDFALSKKEELHAAHDCCEKNKSYPNII